MRRRDLGRQDLVSKTIFPRASKGAIGYTSASVPHSLQLVVQHTALWDSEVPPPPGVIAIIMNPTS